MVQGGGCCWQHDASVLLSPPSPLLTLPSSPLPARYQEVLLGAPPTSLPATSMLKGLGRHEGAIRRVAVYVASNDQSLNLDTVESYVLTVSAPTTTIEASVCPEGASLTLAIPELPGCCGALLWAWQTQLEPSTPSTTKLHVLQLPLQAQTVYGALRGLETFVQLVDTVQLNGSQEEELAGLPAELQQAVGLEGGSRGCG